MPYIGKSPHFGVRDRFIFVASANDTSVSGADANGATLKFSDGAYVDVYLNGVLLKPTTDYNTNTANTIAGLSALSANDEITVIVFDVFSVGDTVSASSGGTFSGNVTFGGNVSGLDVNGTEVILDADGDTSVTADTDDQIDFKAGNIIRASVISTGLQIGGTTYFASPTLTLKDPDSGVGAGTIGGKIDFHSSDSTNAGVSAKINARYEDTDGNTSLSFATGNGSGTTERVRIDNVGRFQIGSDGNLNRTRLITQRTTGVGTSATVIATVGTFSTFGNHFFITGRDANSSANRFCDQLVCSLNGSVVVLHSSTVRASPHSRSYDNSGENLRVTMGGGSYTIQVFCIDQLTN